MQNPICVALDGTERGPLDALIDATEPHAGAFKVGLTAHLSQGPGLVEDIAARRPVFLDLKLHDIPAQVEGAARAAAAGSATWLTVHASGGPDMVKAAVAGGGDEVTILAVTVLTSLDDVALERVGMATPARSQVLRLASVALDAGAPGLVCSPLEVAAIRAEFGASSNGGPVLVVPGIRPAGSATDDQRRTLGPREALKAGADLLVVGRPITGASDPGAAAEAIAASLGL